ncbi:hypothetical protein VTJ04DRAFT_4391 [Mycothermus thermophilus]|uniref:uncharacterized protein n=1 Tax=Humicola insolens TaxID=85995 RepID=UPI00374379E9
MVDSRSQREKGQKKSGTAPVVFRVPILGGGGVKFQPVLFPGKPSKHIAKTTRRDRSPPTSTAIKVNQTDNKQACECEEEDVTSRLALALHPPVDPSNHQQFSQGRRKRRRGRERERDRKREATFCVTVGVQIISIQYPSSSLSSSSLPSIRQVKHS